MSSVSDTEILVISNRIAVAVILGLLRLCVSLNEKLVMIIEKVTAANYFHKHKLFPWSL